MKKWILLCACCLAACSPILPTGKPATVSPTSPSTEETGWLTVSAEPGDRRAADDVTAALLSRSAAICAALQIECPFPVRVELYPNQASFDRHVMNTDMRGFYAISGQGAIQMVSPNVPPAGQSLAYEERVQIAVHEYAHLALDQIDPDLPDWLDEGVSIYLGPHALYDRVCREIFPFERVPRLRDLLDSYSTVPSADLFAYTLVRFIAEQGDMQTLNDLLRSSTRRAEYIAQYPGGLETGWRSFLETTCSGPAPAARLRDHLDALACDEAGGRMPGTPGYDRAANYAARVFKDAGLKPGWKDTSGMPSFFQPVPLVRYTLGPRNDLSYQTGNAAGKFQYTENMYSFYYPGNGQKTLGSGDIVYIGYGIHEPDNGWDEYAGLQLKDALVIMESRTPEGHPGYYLPGELAKEYASGAKSRILPLIKQGVAGIMIIPPPDISWDTVFANLRSLNYFPAELADPVVPPILFLHPGLVDGLFSGQIYHPLTGEGPYQPFSLSGIKMKLSIEAAQQLFESPNIIAILEGSDPTLKQEYIVVSAHLDHLGTMNGEVYNGANDDATGSAAVLEIARALAVVPPRRSVIFALFTCEEQSHCGADYFLEHPPVPLDHIVANLNLEVLGGVSPETTQISMIGPASLAPPARELSSFIAPLPFEMKEPEQAMSEYQRGDQLSFYQHDIPAIQFASGAWDEYHTPGDDISRIDFSHLSRVTWFILAYVQAISN